MLRRDVRRVAEDLASFDADDVDSVPTSGAVAPVGKDPGVLVLQASDTVPRLVFRFRRKQRPEGSGHGLSFLLFHHAQKCGVDLEDISRGVGDEHADRDVFDIDPEAFRAEPKLATHPVDARHVDDASGRLDTK